VPSVEFCRTALIEHVANRPTPEGISAETLQSLFRSLTELELKSLRETMLTDEQRLYQQVAVERFRTQLAQADFDSRMTTGPVVVNEDVARNWARELDRLAGELVPLQQKSVAAGDLGTMKQLGSMLDLLRRRRREMEGAPMRARGEPTPISMPPKAATTPPPTAQAPVPAKKKSNTTMIVVAIMVVVWLGVLGAWLGGAFG